MNKAIITRTSTVAVLIIACCTRETVALEDCVATVAVPSVRDTFGLTLVLGENTEGDRSVVVGVVEVIAAIELALPVVVRGVVQGMLANVGVGLASASALSKLV
jgi:hypothetical protein